MVDPSPQRGSSWTSRNSRKNYPNHAMLGGEVGLWSSDLNALTALEAKEAVAEIEELGYAALWFGETLGREAFTNASMLLSATGRIVVATGIANIFVRDAWAANAAAKTLAEAYPGRFVLGLGVSHRPMVEMRGHDYRSPLSTMRAYLPGLLYTRGIYLIYKKLTSAPGRIRTCDPRIRSPRTSLLACPSVFEN